MDNKGSPSPPRSSCTNQEFRRGGEPRYVCVSQPSVCSGAAPGMLFVCKEFQFQWDRGRAAAGGGEIISRLTAAFRGFWVEPFFLSVCSGFGWKGGPGPRVG